MIISEYIGTEKSKRTAQVRKNASGFYVDLREDDIVVKVVELYDHSEEYAESVAENWVLGILN